MGVMVLLEIMGRCDRSNTLVLLFCIWVYWVASSVITRVTRNHSLLEKRKKIMLKEGSQMWCYWVVRTTSFA